MYTVYIYIYVTHMKCITQHTIVYCTACVSRGVFFCVRAGASKSLGMLLKFPVTPAVCAIIWLPGMLYEPIHGNWRIVATQG